MSQAPTTDTHPLHDIEPDLHGRFTSLYLCVDGSPLSDEAAALGTSLAGRTGARLVAGHAYAARLHDHRFRQMEGGLPEPFQAEKELQRQRRIHDTLITRGLRLISDSYLDVVDRMAVEGGVRLDRRLIEGRNWKVLLEDIGSGATDLVLIGANGLGGEDGSLGSVCERVVRRLRCDALVVRRAAGDAFERIGVAVDGSAESLGALLSAIAIARSHGGRLELMSSFDPHFHHSAFRAIKDVLSEDAGRVFRFEEQQQLHEDIIDAGLARIYRGHLELAERLARQAGLTDVHTTLLSGKAGRCARSFASDRRITTLFAGRTGVHSHHDLDLGACTEAVLRAGLPVNLFLSARAVDPTRFEIHAEPLTWTDEARERLTKIPDFVRPMVCGAVERRAREAGHTVVTTDLLDEVRRTSHRGPSKAEPQAPLVWTEAATARLERVPEGFMREMTRRGVEVLAAERGLTEIDEALVEARYEAWRDTAVAVQRTLAWSDAALDRIDRVPEFVRNGVIQEVERRCRRRGIETVTEQVLDEFRGTLHTDGSIHEVLPAAAPDPTDPPVPDGSEPVPLPAPFLTWQCESRRDLYGSLLSGKQPRFLSSHLPVVSTSNPSGADFPIRSSNKGVGLLPRPELLESYVERLEACLDATRDQEPWETLEERIRVARALYDHPEHIAPDLLGTIEIFRGQTYQNLLRDPRASLLYTGLGPRYLSYQVDCTVEVLTDPDPRFRFIRVMRTLFERDRFHIQQPPHTLAYLFRVRAVIDKTPKPVGKT